MKKGKRKDVTTFDLEWPHFGSHCLDENEHAFGFGLHFFRGRPTKRSSVHYLIKLSRVDGDHHFRCCPQMDLMRSHWANKFVCSVIRHTQSRCVNTILN